MLKGELSFGTDNFSEQKVLSQKESIVQILKNILFMRRGNMPSLPHLGINIQSYLYSFDDSVDVNSIKNKIHEQCSEILPYLDYENINVYVATPKGSSVPILMLIIPIIIEGKNEDLIIGIQKSSRGEFSFRYEFEKSNNVNL